MILAATGHRPDKLGGYGPAVAERLLKLAFKYLREEQPAKVISGMALGWDTAIASGALMNGIPLIAAVPFAGQESRWPEEAQRVHREILARASEVVVVSSGTYSAFKMQIRNEWMVDHCGKLTALWDGTSGGTANCVRYADRIRKPVDNLWPFYSGVFA